MTYVGRDHRGRIVFHDAVAVGAPAHEYAVIVTPDPGTAPPPAVDPDQAWADIYPAIWALTEHWIAVSRNVDPSSTNDRVMKQFLAAWNPILSQRQLLGPRLRGTVAQKGAAVLAIALAMQRLVNHAQDLGIPNPRIEIDRDRSWLYLTPQTPFRTR